MVGLALPLPQSTRAELGLALQLQARRRFGMGMQVPMLAPKYHLAAQQSPPKHLH